MVERSSSGGRRRTVEDGDEPASKAGGESKRGSAPKFDKKTIALVYDFDGTLSPKPMQEYAFLPQIGVNPADFWAESNERAAKDNADPLITYMRLLYEKAKAKKVSIDRDALVAQGKRVEFYPGVEAWFDEV